MLRYKQGVDILEMLRMVGYHTRLIRQDHLISESSLQYIREGKLVSLATFEKLCEVLNCQLSDLIEYVPNDKLLH